jgi:hypothetical protein
MRWGGNAPVGLGSAQQRYGGAKENRSRAGGVMLVEQRRQQSSGCLGPLRAGQV